MFSKNNKEQIQILNFIVWQCIGTKQFYGKNYGKLICIKMCIFDD